MKHTEKYLSPKWQSLVRSAIKKFFPEREELWCTDFGTDLTIKFEDGSKMFLKGAIYLESKSLKEIVIFTEHNGYFTFFSGAVKKIKVKTKYDTGLRFNQAIEDILQ